MLFTTCGNQTANIESKQILLFFTTVSFALHPICGTLTRWHAFVPCFVVYIVCQRTCKQTSNRQRHFLFVSKSIWGPNSAFHEMIPLQTPRLQVGVRTQIFECSKSNFEVVLLFDFRGRKSKFEVGLRTSVFDLLGRRSNFARERENMEL